MTTFTTPTAIAAVLDIPAGRIQVIAADRPDTTVEVRPFDAAKSRDVKAAEQTKVEYTDGVLRVESPTGPKVSQMFGPSGSIEVTVQVPAGSRVTAKAASAEFRVVGRLDDVTFEAPHGSVKVDEAVTAHLKLQAGAITIGRLTGPADLETSNGDITVTEAVRGAVVLKTSAGNLSVGAAAGVSATLDAGTSSGRIHNSLRNTEGPTAQLDIRATTSYGNISARSL